jgi:hypothetical protein
MNKLDGAQAAIDYERASIDLAWLSGHLVEAFKKTLSDGASIFKFSRKNGLVLIFDSAPIMAHLISDENMLKRSPDHFLRDVKVPGRGKTVKIGGRIPAGSEGSLRSNLGKLASVATDAISAAFDKHAISPSEMWISQRDARNYLKEVSKEIGSFLDLDAVANIDELKFAKSINIPAGDMVGRQVTSFETVEEGNRLHQIMKAAERYFLRKKHDPDEVEEDIEAWIERGARPGSFTDQFINFLDDEGLSRVRVAVSFRIMRAIADAAQQEGICRDLVRYVQRLQELFIRLVESREETLRVELSSLFGPSGDFDLGAMLASASFCKTLPVWAVWETQLFERQSKEKGDSGVNREICYHFRANGHNPSENKSTFIVRVEAAKHALGADGGGSSQKRLAELLVYDAVLRADDIDPVTAIKQRMELMKGDGGRAQALENLASDLTRSEGRIDVIADQMISILKTRSSAKHINEVTRDPISYFVNVTDGVLDKSSAGAASDHPFSVAGPDLEQRIHWLKNLRITTNSVPASANDFFAFKVVVHIGDRALAPSGGRKQLATSRLTDGRIALMNMLPTPNDEDDESKERKSVYELARKWRKGHSSLAMLYDPRHLSAYSGGSKSENKSHQHTKMAAIRSALLILMQVVGERLLDAMEVDKHTDRLILYRHQLSNKQVGPLGWTFSSEAIFTISQALEHALGTKLNVKLQGSVASPRGDATTKRKQMKSFDAVISAFDMKMSGFPVHDLKKIGIVSFASRPCDVGESQVPSERDTYVVAGRGYLFEPVQEGCVIRRRPNLLDTYEGGDVVNNPSVVKEAVQDLVNEGCNHIVMIAHKYDGRSIGRSSARHRHHENVTFLNDLGASFPKVTFHSVVKDSMRVVRVSEKGAARIGYEIVGREAHAPRLVGDDMKEAFNSEGLIPFYSLATLHVVHAGAGKRPQSGVTTYYMLNPASADALDIRIGNTSLMTTGSPEHSSVVAALRGIHMIESEEGAMRKVVKPVLQPSSWMAPRDINGAGEITALIDGTGRRGGTVELSLTAVAATVSQVLKSLHRMDTAKDAANA